MVIVLCKSMLYLFFVMLYIFAAAFLLAVLVCVLL